MTQLEQQLVNGSYYLRRNLKGTSFWLTCKRRGDSNGDLSENKCVSECVSRGTNVWANKVAYLFRVWLFSWEDRLFLRNYFARCFTDISSNAYLSHVGEDFNLRWQRQRWIGRLSVEDRTGNHVLRLKTMRECQNWKKSICWCFARIQKTIRNLWEFEKWNAGVSLSRHLITR